MVITFECTNEVVTRLGEHSDMRAASDHLPAGAYTTFRTYGGNRVLRLNQHAQRLRDSLALMGGSATLSDEQVRGSIAVALRETHFPESRFRLTLAASASNRAPSRYFVSIEPFTPYSRDLYQRGAACVTVALHRDNPHAKSTAFIAAAGDAYRALPPGIHEGLMVADDGAVLEGLSSSFFAVCDGVLYNEQERALSGITQSLVLELVASIRPGMGVLPTAVHMDDLPHVSECFITSVSREVLPVVLVDGMPIGGGSPGPLTRELMAAFNEMIEREAETV